MRRVRLDVRGPRMALVVGGRVFVTSYTDNVIVCLPWPACDRELGRVRVHRPRGIVHSHDRLYVACYGDPIGRIVVVDPERLRASHGFFTFRPRGIAKWGDAILVSQVNRGRVVAYDRRGNHLRTWDGFLEPRDICVHGNEMWVADTGNDRIARLDLCRSRLVEVLRLRRPNGVATDGRTLVASQWNSGRITLVASGGMTVTIDDAHTPSMVSCHDGVYLVCDDAANCLYVIDA